MFPLALLNANPPLIPPTGILLFNGVNGATTTVNSGTIGTAALFNGAALSTTQAFEGVSSCYLNGGNAFARYDPTATDDNNNLITKSFYMSLAFRINANDSQQRGLIYCENTGGFLLFRAYVESGVVKCVIKESIGTTTTVTVPDLTCAAETWYKLELIRNSATGLFTVKVGSNSVSQAVLAFAAAVSNVDCGAGWGGDSFLGYVDRFIYQPNSIIPY